MDSITFSIILFFLILGFYTIIILYAEGQDQTILINKKHKKWEKIKKDTYFKEYLDVIANYPAWRLAFIISLITTVFLIPLNIILIKRLLGNLKYKETLVYAILNSIIILLTLIFTLTKFIDYFRWHIMCPGWGCIYNYNNYNTNNTTTNN